MCLAGMDIDAVKDGPFVSAGLIESAALCSKEQAVIAVRMRIGAQVIASLLTERAQLLERIEKLERARAPNPDSIEAQP